MRHDEHSTFVVRTVRLVPAHLPVQALVPALVLVQALVLVPLRLVALLQQVQQLRLPRY